MSSAGDTNDLSAGASDGSYIVGRYPNHWVYRPNDDIMDMTRPEPPEIRLPSPGSSLRMVTDTYSVLVSPKKSALIIIDMQNYFLSPALGKDPNSPGNQAKEKLKNVTIPAARRAHMQIIWLNWGLNDEDLKTMPPAIMSGFCHMTAHREYAQKKKGNQSEPKNPLRFPGVEMGPVDLEDGTRVEAGKLLYADTWNADLPPDLLEVYKQGLAADPPDVWLHKNRHSGLWGSSTPCTDFLDEKGLRTLFFAGVNTDQCVGGSLQDAMFKGYDAILIKDSAATSSPEFARLAWEYNVSEEYGFAVTSEAFQQSIYWMLYGAQLGSQ